MPLGDRTGPLGRGSMTGRGLGYCAGYPHPGYMNPAGGGWGRGWGRGRGRGWGRGWGRFPGYPYSPQITKKEEKEILEEEVEVLEEELKAIKSRLSALKAKK